MADNGHKNFGGDFDKAWTEGIENNNWSYLNDVIVKSVDNILDNIGDRMNDAMGTRSSATPLSRRKEDISGKTQTARYQRELHEERERIRQEMARQRREREEMRKAKAVARRNRGRAVPAFPYKDVGAGVSTVNCIVGGIGTGVTVFATLTSFLANGLSMKLAIAPVFIAIFGGMMAKGIFQDKMLTLARRYVEVLGNRQYIDIPTLALMMNKKERTVVRELKRLIKYGFFPQGHLDRNNRTFMVTDEVFDHYIELETKGNAGAIVDSTSRSEDEQEFPTLSPEDSAELSRMIREGNEYIRRFRELNNDIPGVEITAKLDRLEGLLKEIFLRIREHPDQMSRIHELMDYYLPTSEKLVAAYREYDRVSEPGKEILSAKQDIENTLDTINSALGKLLNRLFKDSVLDVTTDAQVLKTVLVQKGLTNEMDVNAKGENK